VNAKLDENLTDFFISNLCAEIRAWELFMEDVFLEVWGFRLLHAITGVIWFHEYVTCRHSLCLDL
jgi:hypothetical protein